MSGGQAANSEREEKRVIGPTELHRLADAVGPQWRCLVYLGGVMGLRFGEAAALQAQDIDLERDRIAINRTVTEVNGRLEIGSPKTQAGYRTLALPGRLTAELANHLDRLALDEPESLVFGDAFGGPIRRSNFRNRVFVPATLLVGVEGLTFHGLRHSAATQWVAEGIDARTVQYRLGHSDPRLVLRLYAHASTDADRRAAETSGTLYWPDSNE